MTGTEHLQYLFFSFYALHSISEGENRRVQRLLLYPILFLIKLPRIVLRPITVTMIKALLFSAMSGIIGIADAASCLNLDQPLVSHTGTSTGVFQSVNGGMANHLCSSQLMSVD